jgi:hypothetical protein
MGYYRGLYVDRATVSQLHLGVTPEVRALFTDSMLHRREITIEDQVVEVYELLAPSQEIADRLDVLGFDRTLALATVDKALEALRAVYRLRIEKRPDVWTVFDPQLEERLRDEDVRELAYLDGYTALDWLRELRTAPPDPDDYDEWRSDDHWDRRRDPSELFGYLDKGLVQGVDDRVALRAVLLALPEGEVRLNIGLVGEERDIPKTYCSEGLAAMRAEAAAHAPIIVLTEGRTDKQVLEPALGLLYPHLADLIRFMDYAERPEGGAGALVRTVRAFAAAGVANRVVALFDNDTAASEALRKFDTNKLPANIRVLHYPRLEVAADYPTLGPPSADAPTGGLGRADVNGLAGSIELYLGRDVLAEPDGTLRPVQWGSYSTGVRQYQGEVIGKDKVHEAYRAKVEAARIDKGVMASQDWSGVRAILELVRTAFA